MSGKITKENVTIIDVEKPGGSTAFVCGGSSCGKTTLLVQALKNIVEQHPERYDVIMVFSESISAEPLQDFMSENKHTQVHFFPYYIPELVDMMVKINKGTDNRYGVLVILDDVLDGLRGKMASKLINIYRNSNISTIISIQYLKFVTPAMRNSFHRVFILGARNSENRKSIIETFIRGQLRDLGHKNLDQMDRRLRGETAMRDNDRKLIMLDQIKDELTFHTIKK